MSTVEDLRLAIAEAKAAKVAFEKADAEARRAEVAYKRAKHAIEGIQYAILVSAGYPSPDSGEFL